MLFQPIKKDAVYSEEELAQFQKIMEQRQKLEQEKQQEVLQEHHEVGEEKHKYLMFILCCVVLITLEHWFQLSVTVLVH